MEKETTPDVLGALAKPRTQLEETLAHYRRHGAPPPYVFEDGDLGPMTRPLDPEPEETWPNS